MKNYFHLLFLFAIISCVSKNPIEKALFVKNGKIQKVFNNLNDYEVQIKFTEIIRDENNVTFKDYNFQVDDSCYFYPASSVKFPIAVLALEKLNELPNIDKDTEFKIKGDSTITTIAKEITKIFAVSDNEAYNRLYEFLGKDDINKRLHKKGIQTFINHRLATTNSADLTSKDIIFFTNNNDTILVKGYTSKAIQLLTSDKLQKGKGFIRNDSLIEKSMDFSKKNYLPITALHNMMKSLIFPNQFSKEKQFHLSEDNRKFLLNAMKIIPRNAGYSEDHYYDGYVKFLVFGDTKERIPETFEIYNKVGYAYGYLTDCAYIINKKEKKEYIITATIHVNENEIFNDNNYEYESVGIPFLAELGRQLTD